LPAGTVGELVASVTTSTVVIFTALIARLLA
jgi:hypothetical protein